MVSFNINLLLREYIRHILLQVKKDGKTCYTGTSDQYASFLLTAYLRNL